MSFFKDLKEDVGVMGDFENDDNQMVDTLSGSSSDDFDEFNLSEEDALGVDDDMIEKMQDEDSLNLEKWLPKIMYILSLNIRRLFM